MTPTSGRLQCYDDIEDEVDLTASGTARSPLAIRLQRANPRYYHESQGYCYLRAARTLPVEDLPQFARLAVRRVVSTSDPRASIREISETTGLPTEVLLRAILENRTRSDCADVRRCLDDPRTHTIPTSLRQEILHLQRTGRLRPVPPAQWQVRPPRPVDLERQRLLLRPSPLRVQGRVGSPGTAPQVRPAVVGGALRPTAPPRPR